MISALSFIIVNSIIFRDLGYFVYDFCDMLLHNRLKSKEILLHHLLVSDTLYMLHIVEYDN